MDTIKSEPVEEEYTKLANLLSDNLNADIIIYTGEINDSTVDVLINYTKDPGKKENVVLLLTTNGGSPDAAYRMARCLQRQYKNFILFIYGICKSAGTLVAVGANEIILSDFGEFGPLDIQLGMRDELFEMFSGLNITQAINSLATRSINTWREILIDFKAGSRGQITTKLASEIAANLTVGLYDKIYAQIDPAQLGQIERSMNIASDYGKRLAKKTKNVKDEAIDKLISGYPSHSFVIDREEAQELFNIVRNPNELEEKLAECIKWAIRNPLGTPFTIKINIVKKEKLNGEQICSATTDEGGNRTHSGGSKNNSAASKETVE